MTIGGRAIRENQKEIVRLMVDLGKLFTAPPQFVGLVTEDMEALRVPLDQAEPSYLFAERENH